MLECQTWKGSTIHESNLLEKCIKALDPKRKEKGKLNNGWVCMYVCVFETLMMCLIAEKTNENARKKLIPLDNLRV